MGTLEQEELPVRLFQIPACFGPGALAVQGEHESHLSWVYGGSWVVAAVSLLAGFLQVWGAQAWLQD